MKKKALAGYNLPMAFALPSLFICFPNELPIGDYAAVHCPVCVCVGVYVERERE